MSTHFFLFGLNVEEGKAECGSCSLCLSPLRRFVWQTCRAPPDHDTFRLEMSFVSASFNAAVIQEVCQRYGGLLKRPCMGAGPSGGGDDDDGTEVLSLRGFMGTNSG